jgi:plasmid stabilization system protein ParE
MMPWRAERTGTLLLDRALSLTRFPERGRMVLEFHQPELREVIFRSYRLIYRVNTARSRVSCSRASASQPARATRRRCG